MKTSLVAAILLFFCITGCRDQEINQFIIDERALPYVDNFFKEATKRAVSVPRENLILEFTDQITKEHCGECIKPKNGRKGQRKILIAMNKECWESQPEQNKEALIFHELGHCLLNRGHNDELFPSGAPHSIMTTVLDGPYQPCYAVIDDSPEAIKKCNRTIRRAYYIDELLGIPAEQTPDWGKL